MTAWVHGPRRTRYRFFAATAAAVALVLFLGAPDLGAQGETGFLRGKDHVDVSVFYSLDTYDRFWVGTDSVRNAAAGFGDVERTTYGVYAAWGATDTLDVVLNAA
ncbi:MAG TPA: hypothetical protein VFP98_00870, partial [Candidatus Polarisedimenticolia bacterium]|nr:hypothetical protein [Candidatus Polarisedimenticolia bacterium]